MATRPTPPSPYAGSLLHDNQAPYPVLDPIKSVDSEKRELSERDVTGSAGKIESGTSGS